MSSHDSFDLAALQLPSDLLFLDVEVLADQAAMKTSSLGTLASFSSWASAPATTPSSGSSLSSASTWSPA